MYLEFKALSNYGKPLENGTLFIDLYSVSNSLTPVPQNILPFFIDIEENKGNGIFKAEIRV